MAFGWDDAAGVALNTGLGLLLEGHNDQRQIRQQQKLTDMQIAAQKNLSNYSYDKQFEMWLKTGPKGQMEQYKAAGLNPALMYGMGGGGGVTTGGAASTSVGSGQAPGGGGEIMGLMLGRAQLGLIQAQAEKTKAEADNIRGPQTDLQNTQIASLTQGINNQKAVEELTRVETQLKQLDVSFQGQTYEDRAESIEYTARKLAAETRSALAIAGVDEGTVQSKIRLLQTEVIGAQLRNGLTAAQTSATKQSVEESKSRIEVNKSVINLQTAEITQIAHSIAQKWQELDLQSKGQTIENKKVGIEAFKASLQDKMNQFIMDHPSLMQQLGGGLKEGGHKIDQVTRTIDDIIKTLTKKWW